MKDILSYLFSRQNLGIKLGLDRTFALMEACGNPQKSLRAVQIAGTNGKGSTAALLASMLQQGGYRTGLSTSPHLYRVNERIRINGQAIPDEVIAEFVEKNQPAIEETGSSFFEIITALGFWYFVRNQVDIAILETGLGGRLDSVTVCEPDLTIITPISLDHVEILGENLAEIAFEKAGILKPGIPCLSPPQAVEAEEVLLRRAEEVATRIHWVTKPLHEDVLLGLSGAHQRWNGALAVKALTFLPDFPVPEKKQAVGLAQCSWPGRFQTLQRAPLVVFDVGHNEDGIQAFLNEWEQCEIPGNKILVIALQRRKNIQNLIYQITQQFNQIICTETDSHMKMPAVDILPQFSGKGDVIEITDPEQAIRRAMMESGADDAVAVVGSHYLGPAVSAVFKIPFDTL